MTTKETAAMLKMFSAYWPTYKVLPGEDGGPGTVEIWAQFLDRYSKDDCIQAMQDFRQQPERVFAPTASEFEGALVTIAGERFDAQKRKLALEYRAPANDSPYLEEVWREVVIGKDKKGQPIKTVLPYLQQTKARREQQHQEMLAKGYEREVTVNPGGLMSYCYRRPRNANAQAKDLAGLINLIAKPVPKADPVDLSELHDWQETLSFIDGLPEQPKPKKKRRRDERTYS